VSAEGFLRLEAELCRARAEALGRAGERLEEALARLAELDRQIHALRAGPRPESAAEAARRLAACLAARDRARQEAERLRQFLVIQREALGLVRHGMVDEVYRLPRLPR
jgi:hypothetical protein